MIILTSEKASAACLLLACSILVVADLQAEASKDLEAKSSKTTGAPVNDEVRPSGVQLSAFSQLNSALLFFIALN